VTEAITIEDTVLDVLSDVLREPVAGLRQQPILAVYEWDSLSSLEALSQLESRLKISLDLRSYQAVRTVADLVALVSEISGRTGAAQL
jgi:acyl carrier protein